MTYTLAMTQNTHNGTHKIVHEQMSHPHTHTKGTRTNDTHKWHAQTHTEWHAKWNTPTQWNTRTHTIS